VTVKGINKGPGDICDDGNGIVFNEIDGGPYSAILQHDTVTGFQSYGIYIRGNISTRISQNTVTGYSESGNSYQAAIFITADFLPGTISKNTTTFVPQASRSLYGIDLYESSDMTIKPNSLVGSAIGVFSYCESQSAASNELIEKNNVQGAAPGIVLEASVGPYSTCGPVVDNSLVKANVVHDSGGATGILLYECTDQIFPCQASTNVVLRNTITGYGAAVVDLGTGNFVSKNHSN